MISCYSFFSFKSLSSKIKIDIFNKFGSFVEARIIIHLW